MAMFLNWLVNQNTATLLRLRLLEHADFFNPSDYNPLFNSELEKVIARIHDPNLRQQVSELQNFDWANYVVRSLQRSGFKDDDIQEHFHQLVIKLLVSPGRLFAGWEPQRHGPLDRRFRTSVWNGIRNAQAKTRNRRKWVNAVDPTVLAGQFAGMAPYSDVVDQFRSLVAQRLGKLALEILDTRLAGKETKKMVGKAEFGTPSAFFVKKEVQAIKELARQFAAQSGDLEFLRLVNQAFSAQAATVAKRKAAVAAQ
jgi:hypothetical protein